MSRDLHLAVNNVRHGEWTKVGLRRHTGGNPPGGDDVEARVAKLETHVDYIRSDISDLKADMKELRADVTAIKHRLAYFAGAAAIVVAAIAWVANNRFDQLVELIAK